MSVHFRKVIWFIVVLLVLGSGIVAYLSGTTMVRLQEKIDEAAAVSNAADTLMRYLLNAETGQRGYVITFNRDYLVPYERASTQVENRMEALSEAIGNDPELEGRAWELRNAVEAKVKEMAEVIRLRDSKGFDAAAEQVNRHLGKSYMDAIRALVEEITRVERQRTADYANKLRVAGNLTSYAFISFVTLLLVLLLFLPDSQRERIVREEEQRRIIDALKRD